MQYERYFMQDERYFMQDERYFMQDERYFMPDKGTLCRTKVLYAGRGYFMHTCTFRKFAIVNIDL
jgi:hypothetical protein